MTTLRDIIEIVITGDGAKARSEFDKVGKSAATNLKSAQSSADKMSATLTKVGVAAVGSGIVIGAGLFKAAQAASSWDLAQEKLQNTIKNSPALVGASTQAFLGQAEALQNTTVFARATTVQVQAMLGMFKLNQQQILQLTPLVEDFAAKFGIDTVTAARAVGKAFEGNAALLNRYGLITGITKKTTDDYNRVLVTLGHTVKGFADTQGKTFSGQLQIMKNKMTEVEQEVGAGAIPVIRDLATIVGGAAKGFEGFNKITGGAAGEIAAWGSAALIAGGAASVVAGQVIKMIDRYGILKDKITGAQAATDADTAATEANTTAVEADTAAVEGLGAASVTTQGEVAGLGTASATSAGSAGLGELSTGVLGLTGLLGGLATAAAGTGLILSSMWEKSKDKGPVKTAENIQAFQDALDKLGKHGGPSGSSVASAFANIEKSDAPGRAFLDWAAGAHLSAQQTALAAKALALLDPSLKNLSSELGSSGTAAHRAASSQGDLQSSLDATQHSYLKLDDAMQNTLTFQDKLNGDTRTYQGAILDVGDAVQKVADAQKTYNADVKAGKQNTAQGQQDLRDLQRSWLDLSGNIDTAKTSIEQYAADKAHYDLQNTTKNTAWETNAYIGTLRNLAATTTGPVHNAIEDLLSHLQAIPSKKSIQMYLDDVAFNRQLAADAAAINRTFGLHITAAALGAPSTYGQSGGAASSGNAQIQVKDKGGWIEGSPGQPVPMIGHGGEYVLSRDMLRGAATPGLNLAHTRAGGSGGGDVYHITINTLSSHGMEQAIFDAITHGANNGKRFSKKAIAA